MVDPSDLVRAVFEEHIKHYGDPDLQFQFNRGNSQFFNRLDIFLWKPTDRIPMTTFSTMGMADVPMEGLTFRCEIHWTIRGKLSEVENSEAAAFLANLADYPFKKNTGLDHWHIIQNLAIPKFHKCSNVLFHPRFTNEGWDKIAWNSNEIKILNMVPITNEERQMALRSGINSMLDHLYESRSDIFSDRS